MVCRLAPAESNRETCAHLATFVQDAERLLAALCACINENYRELEAHAAAECWLHLFEKRLEVAEDLPDLIDITADAVAHFVATHQYICIN